MTRRHANKTLGFNPKALSGLTVEALDFSEVPTVEQLAAVRSEAFATADVDEFAWLYLRSESFSKWEVAEPGVDLRSEAIKKFRSSEEACRLSNSQLVDLWSRARLNQRVLRSARCEVARILGSFPMDEFISQCGFGPGASTSLRRKEASHQNKWARSAHITEEALPYYVAFSKWSSVTLPSRCEIVSGNKITTVPKNRKTDRCIAIEPDWNMFLQKGVGRLIRRRLWRRGLLTADAQDRNAALAREGSVTGSLATLDLSAASDSISLALCEALLPHDWFRVLMDLRSRYGEVDGSLVEYEKISSMGNGFTFELETLLFYALVTSTCRVNGIAGAVSVYGDDIICPTIAVPGVLEILHHCGFVVNENKTFWSGDFRESCGGHYFRGRNVTPFYIYNEPSGLCDLITLGNHLVRWSSRQRLSILPDRFLRLHQRIRQAVPRSLRGPDGVEGCLWVPWDLGSPRWNSREQHYVQDVVLRKQVQQDVSESYGSLLYKLWVESPDVETSRLSRATSREVFGKTVTYRDQWESLGVRIALP